MSNVNIVFDETYGYELRVTIQEWDTVTSAWAAIDISSFTTKVIEILRPDGTTVTEVAAFYTDGTDGILSSVFTEADAIINQVGIYRYQAKLSNSTQLFKSTIGTFNVDDALM